jgi:hypothetical protein
MLIYSKIYYMTWFIVKSYSYIFLAWKLRRFSNSIYYIVVNLYKIIITTFRTLSKQIAIYFRIRRDI